MSINWGRAHLQQGLHHLPPQQPAALPAPAPLSWSEYIGHHHQRALHQPSEDHLPGGNEPPAPAFQLRHHNWVAVGFVPPPVGSLVSLAPKLILVIAQAFWTVNKGMSTLNFFGHLAAIGDCFTPWASLRLPIKSELINPPLFYHIPSCFYSDYHFHLLTVADHTLAKPSLFLRHPRNCVHCPICFTLFGDRQLSHWQQIEAWSHREHYNCWQNEKFFLLGDIRSTLCPGTSLAHHSIAWQLLLCDICSPAHHSFPNMSCSCPLPCFLKPKLSDPGKTQQPPHVLQRESFLSCSSSFPLSLLVGGWARLCSSSWYRCLPVCEGTTYIVVSVSHRHKPRLDFSINANWKSCLVTLPVWHLLGNTLLSLTW